MKDMFTKFYQTKEKKQNQILNTQNRHRGGFKENVLK